MKLYNELTSGMKEKVVFIPRRVMICLLHNKIDVLLDKLLINPLYFLFFLLL